MKVSNLQTIADTFERFLTKKMDNITFFVTSRCNLRCKYCFNTGALGRKDDLTLEEIKKIFDKFDSLKSILLSGGEPYMRDDIYDILDYFITKKNITSFGIPSNCVDTQRTLTKTEYLVTKYLGVSFVVCCSMDPTEELHNRFRGPGIFQRVVETARELAKLAKKHPNLLFLVNSVVTKEAVPHLDAAIDFVYKMRPSLHTMDIVRTYSEKDKEAFADFTKDDYAQILKSRLRLDRLYKEGDLLMPLYKLRTKILTQTQADCVDGIGKWPTPCLSGITRLVLDANGTTRLCENRPVLGNLRDYDYDYRKLLGAVNISEMLKEIVAHKCDCNHIVTLRESIETYFPQAVLKFLFCRPGF